MTLIEYWLIYYLGHGFDQMPLSNWCSLIGIYLAVVKIWHEWSMEVLRKATSKQRLEV